MGGTVSAELNYFAGPECPPAGETLHYYADFSATTNVRLEPHRVPIRDGRDMAGRFDLDREGIALARFSSEAGAVDADSERFLAECAALIRALTGASAAYGGGLHYRFAGADDPADRYDKGPAHYVHADYSNGAALNFPAFVGASIAGARRWAIYNLWRVLTPPPHRVPLAVCDASSLAPADEVETEVVMAYPGREAIRTHTILYRPSPAHRWLWFSGMTPGEVLVFKSHDSAAGLAKRVAHSAFERGQGGPRISAEARVLALFD